MNNRIRIVKENLQRLQAQRLEVSRRGSGLNATWRIRLEGKSAILKTYSSRRGRVRTAVSCLSHRLTGRSSYTARGRRNTERQNLSLWRSAGFDVPALLPNLPESEMPIPHLCMESLDGILLSNFLADASVPLAAREETFVRFLSHWGGRHSHAEEMREPRLIQEHATLEHVMISGPRFVTFDLEVSYLRPGCLIYCVGAEICGYVRSLLIRLPSDVANRFLRLIISRYPRRSHLEATLREFLNPDSPVRRFAQGLDKRFFRKPGRLCKYNVAEVILREISSGGL